MSTDVQDDRTLSDRVAEEIRVLLTRRRMSGRELARRLDVSPGWVSYRLTGTQPIDLNDLQRVAAVLGVSVSDLLPKTTVWKSRDPLAQRVVATVGEARKRRHRPGRPVRQTRPIDQKTHPLTPAAVGR